MSTIIINKLANIFGGEMLDYEQLGISAVVHAISKTNRLKPILNSVDKEPSFDGKVYIYDNDIYAKNNIKCVPVQVKGKGVHSKVRNSIKYSVSVIDLKNFMTNGGVMFFVVYIDKGTGDTKQIYYSALLPFKINELLRNQSDQKKEISVHFQSFPSDPQDITELFLNFYSDAQKQTSFAGKAIPSVEDLRNRGVLESLTCSYISVKGDPGIISYPKMLNGKEMYVYANIKNGIAPIPIEYCEAVTQLKISSVENMPASVNGTVYYNDVKKIITADEIILHIGSSFTIKIPNTDFQSSKVQPLKLNITTELKGTLRQRICSLRFLIAIFESGAFELSGIEIHLNYPDKKLKEEQLEDYKKNLSTYIQYADALEKLHVKKDLSLDEFTDEDYRKLIAIVEAIENETPVKINQDSLSIRCNLDFGGLHLLVLCEKRDDGTYNIWDYFDKHIDVCAKTKSGEYFPASQYSIMTENDFLTVDNLYLPNVVNDFFHTELQSSIAADGNYVMLEMLKAYDKNQSMELLSAIKQLYAWLETASQYIDPEVILINRLQIAKRERELTFAEKQQLATVAMKSGKIEHKIGAFILLNEQNEAEQLLKEMTAEKREMFMSFPIFYFFKKGICYD